MGSGSGWTARYERVRELRPMGTARVFHCRSEAGEPVLVVASEQEEKLARVREAHSRVDAPLVAKIVGGGDGYLTPPNR